MGSQANTTVTQAKRASALHSKSIPEAMTNVHKHTQQQTSRTVASKVSASAIPLTDYVESPKPLFGNKVEFLHKVNHYAINNWTEMVEK